MHGVLIRITESALPEAINNSGEIVGFSNNAAGYRNAFLYSNGVLTNLQTIDGRDSSWAFGINDNGEVVGQSFYQLTGEPRAFLYYGSGPMEDLNSLIDPNSGWILESANAINDNGQIVGIGINPSGNDQAFLLTPTPEPSTLVLLAAGAFIVAGYVWRIRRRVAANESIAR